jgi:hypothetical protein
VWSWGYVSTVVPDLAPAASFFRNDLGLAPLAEGEFTGLGARGELYTLGRNARLAVVEPAGDGIASRHLQRWRGGLCHMALVLPDRRVAGRGPRTTSPAGIGSMLEREEAGGLLVELLDEELDAPPPDDAAVISELDHVAAVVPSLECGVEAFRSIGISEDHATSRLRFPELGTRNAVLPSRWGYLELNEADTDEGAFGSVAATQGAGIAGLTVSTSNLAVAIERLRDRGVGVTDPRPVVAEDGSGRSIELGRSAVVSMRAAHGTRIFLFSPSDEAPRFTPEAAA